MRPPAKPSTYVVDCDNLVHFRWCEAGEYGQPYVGHDTTTAVEMMTLIRRGDSQNQFGSVRQGPSILSACTTCVQTEALSEATSG